jgi:uncharacterized protein (TIGR04551 family)
MVFKKSLNFFMALALASNIWAEEEEKKEQIPELPAKEGAMLGPKENDELPLVTYEQVYSSGFFSDNRYNQGPASNLNALAINGNFWLNFRYFRNATLGTYVPSQGRGTSLMHPNLSIHNSKSDGDSNKDKDKNPAQNQFTALMRLRLDPTINVSETVRIKGSVNIFDNMVLGSTPSYLMQGPAFMSSSQASVNSWASAINIRRIWAEANFAIGDLRFGRMPFHWGLGILHNSGDDIGNDYGDQIDGIFFSTRIGDHFLTPGYSIAYAGPRDKNSQLYSTEANQPNYLPESSRYYPLETSDLTHVLSLSLLKRDSEFLLNKKREEGRLVFNYGAWAAYRRQSLDTKALPTDNSLDSKALSERVVKREANVGELSLWSEFIFDTFHLEIEAAGIWGKYQVGENKYDVLSSGPKKDIWLLKGGLALESRYGFLNDRLQVGLDGGIASYDADAGFGKDETKSTSNTRTYFQFNKAYNIDLLLHKEVLGGVFGTAYIKPHIAYFFSRNLGIRGDVIAAIAPNKAVTPGKSNWLGTEIDVNAFFRTDSGFYLQLAYGLLFPLNGLNNKLPGLSDNEKSLHGTARLAQTVQAFFGVTF